MTPTEGAEPFKPREPREVIIRPGDWKCSGCGAQVFANRSECFKCGGTEGEELTPTEGAEAWVPQPREPREPKPVRPGDWACSGCGAHNFASRSDCFRCGGTEGEEMTPTT